MLAYVGVAAAGALVFLSMVGDALMVVRADIDARGIQWRRAREEEARDAEERAARRVAAERREDRREKT